MINSEKTIVCTHKLFGSFRIVNTKEHGILFLTSDIAACLRYKNIKKSLKSIT